MIKNTFLDIILVYKNFLNWTKIKIITFFLWFTYAIVMVIPVAIITLLYAWFNHINIEKISFISPQLSNDLWLNILLIISYIFAMVWYFYSFVFLWKYHLKLVEERKKVNFKIFKNIFKLKELKKFFQISLVIISIIWIMFLVWITIMLSLQNSFWFENSVNKILNWPINSFSIIFFVFILITFYIIYRIIFAYAFMIDKQESTIKSIKSSFKNSSWIKKFLTTIFIVFIFMTIYLPFKSIKYNFEREKAFTEKYKNMIEVWYTDNEQSLFNSLNIKYASKTKEEIIDRITALWYIILFIEFVYFFLFFGITNIVYISIYKNIIKK